MTEYELASLHQGQGNLLGAIVANYFTLLAAYLVAGYLAAHRLALSMTVLVTTLFILGSSYLILNAYGITRNLAMIAAEIRAHAEAGKGLAWHNAALLPQWGTDAIVVTTVGIMAAGLMAAVYFFFHCRRMNRSADTDTQKPTA